MSEEKEWAFVDDGRGGYAIVLRVEKLPEFLSKLGYIEVPKNHIIPLLAEQAHQLGFIEADRIEPARLCAYKYITESGWIIRDGATYGVDYLLYSGPPGQVHSQYGVLINDKSNPGETLKWRYFAGIARTVYSAKKEFLLAQVSDQTVRLLKIDRFLPESMNKK